MLSKTKSRRQRANSLLVTMAWPFAMTTMHFGCDSSDEPIGSGAPQDPPAGDPVPPESEGSSGRLEFEDERDQSILADRSNLRPEDVSVDAWRRWLSTRAREVMNQAGLRCVLDESDLSSVRVAWFVSGAGVVLQNTAPQRLYASARFVSTESAECDLSVPTKLAETGTSIVLAAHDHCEYESALVSLHDECGTFVGSLEVQP